MDFCLVVFVCRERIIRSPGGRVGRLHSKAREAAMVTEGQGELRAVSFERSQHAPGSSIKAQTSQHPSLLSPEWQVTQEVTQQLWMLAP